AKLWLGLLGVALALRSAWIGSLVLGMESSALPRRLLSTGEGMALTLALVTPVCLLRGTERKAVPVLAGLVAGGLALVVGHLNWVLAARIAAYGFGFDLPPALVGVGLLALALAAWVSAVTALLLRR